MQPPASDKTVAELFLRFLSRYGHRWASSMPSDGTSLEVFKRQWAADLRGLDGAAIGRGLKRLLDRDDKNAGWPPGSEEFRKLCQARASDLGIPETDEAYRDACCYRWSHEIVYLAATKVGQGDLASGRATKGQFAKEYGKLLKRAIAGETFEKPAAMRIKADQPKIELTTPSRPPKDWIAEARAMLNGETNQ